MKKIFLVFILLFVFKIADAQLQHTQFIFNIYENNERIRDSRKFFVTVETIDRKKPDTIHFLDTIPLGDTAKNMGYDYEHNVIDLFFKRIATIHIVKGTDTMHIIIDYPEASAWTSLGMDKIDFKKGTFKITGAEWPQNSRQRPMDNRYFPFLDENFDWEKIRQR